MSPGKGKNKKNPVIFSGFSQGQIDISVTSIAGFTAYEPWNASLILISPKPTDGTVLKE
jgi:hypothetical protein